MADDGRAAGRWLLEEIPASKEPTLRGLADESDGRLDRQAVGVGLRWLKRNGLVRKMDQPWNKARPDRGHGWELTERGREVLSARLERRAQREIEEYRGA